MASTIRGSFQGLADVRRDLESVQVGLGRELTAAITHELSPLTAAIVRHTPSGPGPNPRAADESDDRLPHVRETIRSRVAGSAIVAESTHPAAGWLNFGGTVSPKGHPITISGFAMGEKGGAEALPRIEADVSRRIDGLLARHGLK